MMNREIKFEENDQVEEIESLIWDSLFLIRDSVIVNNNHVLLFLLSIHNDSDIINNIQADGSDIKVLIKKEVDGLENYKAIYNSYFSILESIPNDTLYELFLFFNSFNQEVLKANFSQIFDFLLGIVQNDRTLPKEVSCFLSNLVWLPTNPTIYNPFAGLASFGVFSKKHKHYLGQECNISSWAIGQLRIMAHGLSGTSKYLCQDSLINWPSSEKFDLIISNPPFNLKIDNKLRISNPEIRSIEQFLIEKGVSSLKESGKLIAVLSMSFLSRGGAEQRLREKLVELDLIETIIQLPSGLLRNTGIPIVILVINKQKQLKNQIRLIDASNFVFKKNVRDRILDYKSLESIQSSETNSEFIRIVSKDLIKDNEYNLSIPRYFQKEIDGTKLSEILEPIVGDKNNFPKTGKLVSYRDLNDNKLNFFLNQSNLEIGDLSRSNIRVISESCLLVSSVSSLKPTFFEYKGEPIYINHNIFAFKVHEALINISYLINEFDAPYVLGQIDSYRVGTTMPIVHRDDILKVIMILPSLIEQNAKVQGLKELSDKIRVLQEEHDALKHGKLKSDFNEFASLKHTLGRPRQNILDWSDNLIHFLTNKQSDIISLNSSFKKFYDIDILSALKEIKSDVNFITEILERGENGLIMDEYPNKLVSLFEVNSIINNISGNSFNFIINNQSFINEKLENRGIDLNATLLRTLLENLLTNANKHAFSEKAISNEVVIKLKESVDKLTLEISNNGKPFPKNYNRDKFVIKYSTVNPKTGSGLGGYDINRIAAHFNNPDWELILNEDPIYPTKFVFSFLIKPMK